MDQLKMTRLTSDVGENYKKILFFLCYLLSISHAHKWKLIRYQFCRVLKSQASFY